MSALRIYLLGKIRIDHVVYPAEAQIPHSSETLLAYLLLQPHRNLSREILINLLWANHSRDQARGCLSTALWRLRSWLEPEGIPRGTYLLTTSTGEIGFNWNSDYWLDSMTFEQRASQALAQPIQNLTAAGAGELEQALQLYRGDLLEGIYDDWAIRERERLRLMHLNSLAYLMHYYQQHEAYEASLAYGQQILYHDPLREEIHREVMRLYLANGQRALAVRQYEICRQILAVELGIEPMEATQALHTQMTLGSRPYGQQYRSPGSETDLQAAVQQLRLALQAFDKTQKHLQQAVDLIERAIGR